MYVGGYGVIVETDPTVVEVEADDGTARLVRTENMPSAKKGDRVVFGGTITEDGSVEISRTRSVVRDPWETAYMYLISAIAALIVAILGIDLWHIDRRTLSLEPRETPLHETLRGSNNG